MVFINEMKNIHTCPDFIFSTPPETARKLSKFTNRSIFGFILENIRAFKAVGRRQETPYLEFSHSVLNLNILGQDFGLRLKLIVVSFQNVFGGQIAF